MLQRLEQLPFDGSCDWDTPLSVWRYYREKVSGKSENDGAQLQESDINSSSPSEHTVPQSVNETPLLTEDTSSPNLDTNKSYSKEKPISFRVTCTRGGRKHCFSSMDAARSFGAGLARKFGWTVQLKNSDLEVLLTILGDDMSIAIALNRESKFKGNITHFGPTTLRSTIAYGLLR